MTTCRIRPFRLRNSIQHYAWGTRDREAFIPHFLGILPEAERPYAELWIGAHPSAPSEVFCDDGQRVSLESYLSEFPEQLLGTRCIQHHGNRLPFLLKILSASEPLSIQAHPSAAQAIELHKALPQHYPDTSAKPEFAFALDGLTALVGFQPADRISETLTRYPEIREILDPERKLRDSVSIQEHFKSCLQTLLACYSEATIDPQARLHSLVQRLHILGDHLDERERLFLEMYERYGARDVGLIFIFLLNLVTLEQGQAIFLEAGVPHAYLRGNIIECMSNSDNVIRAGLTPKFIDLENLPRVLDYSLQWPEILDALPEERSVHYTHNGHPFEVVHFQWGADESEQMESDGALRLVLVTHGNLKIYWENESSSCCASLRRGHSMLIPANLSRYSYKMITDVELFEVRLPQQ